MKTIKFRAWDKERKEWHYFVIKPNRENVDTTISFGSPIYNDLKKNLVNWGQYTGLDENGVEMYEDVTVDGVKYAPVEKEEQPICDECHEVEPSQDKGNCRFCGKEVVYEFSEESQEIEKGL